MIKKKKTLKGIISIVFAISGMFTLLYLLATYERQQELNDRKFINQDYKITRGIITKKSVYKSHSILIRVKYYVNWIFHEESARLEKNDKISEGDSITIKYSRTKPELMMTEFDDEF